MSVDLEDDKLIQPERALSSRRVGKSLDTLSRMTVAQLRAMASKREIKGVSRMKKAELITALSAPQRAAVKPMTADERLAVYQRQNGGKALTPRQRRQIRRKAMHNGEKVSAQVYAATRLHQ